MDWLTYTISIYNQAPPLTWMLVGMMLLDIVSGLVASAGKWSSKVSAKGMWKKTAILVTVGASALVEQTFKVYMPQAWQPNIPQVAQLTTLFFFVTETISVLENARTAGAPIPARLTDLLAKTRDQISGEEHSNDQVA